MKSSFEKRSIFDGSRTLKRNFLSYLTHTLRFFLTLFLLFILGNFSEIQAHRFAFIKQQIPVKPKAKVAVIPVVAVKPIGKNKTGKGKGKTKKVIKKDSVMVDIDPTTISPPLFEKHL